MFTLAATGSAVGLGNIWKFPYIAGEHGGGAFVLVYLACLALIGVPIMMAEILIGRRGRQSPINTLQMLGREEDAGSHWGMVGFIGVAAGVIIISFYSVIAGWALAYVARMASGMFSGVTAAGSQSIFSALISDPERLLAWHTIFMVMTTLVVARGVRSGLEQAVKVMMPVLFFLLLLLTAYALNIGEFERSFRFLFQPDFSALSRGGVLIAMGHAFFTLSLGVGAIMVYGSYLPSRVSIAKAALVVALMDTLVALLAGVTIFAIVFANGLPVAAGPGLIFQTLPIAFGQMPGGLFFGTLFFVLLVLAAWTSAISLVEPAVAWLVENRALLRVRAAVVVGVIAWLLGIATVMSFSDWSFRFRFAGEYRNTGVFDLLDILTSGIMLPLGGFSIALFAGWAMSRRSVRDELGGRDGLAFRLWYLAIRYVAPLAVSLVFLHTVGIFGVLG
jgi:NSS family neurotransmitter:Na+ symporter